MQRGWRGHGVDHLAGEEKGGGVGQSLTVLHCTACLVQEQEARRTSVGVSCSHDWQGLLLWGT